LLFKVSNRIVYALLIYSMCATCPAYLIILDRIALAISGEERETSHALNFLHHDMLLPPSRSTVLLSALLSNIPNARPSLALVTNR
jgi:hypothetical protein